MHPFALTSVVIIVLNVVISGMAFSNSSLTERFMFRVDDVLIKKEYYRLITSGFLHISWLHLIFNMISLYLFSEMFELYMGVLPYIIVYLAGLVGGNLLALFIHRNHGDYSSVGASGAVCGIVFASIAVFPGLVVHPLVVPINVPGWLYGIIYILYTIYGVRSKADNIGHEAHLGGALVGMYAAIIFHPEAVMNNYVAIAVISLPSILFIYFIVKRPHTLMVENLYFEQHTNTTIDDRYNMAKRNEQLEIDDILEKIHQKGIGSLSKAEKEKLDRYSGK